MKLEDNREAVRAVLRALGIDPLAVPVTGVDVSARVGDVVRVTVHVLARPGVVGALAPLVAGGRVTVVVSEPQGGAR